MQMLQRTEVSVSSSPARAVHTESQGHYIDLSVPPPVNYIALALQTDICFRPVWNVTSNYLTGFIARHAHDDELSGYEKGSSALTDAIANADLGLLARAVAELTAALQQGSRMVLIVPVLFDTLTRQPGKDRYFEFFSNIPAHVRALIALQIKETPVLASKENIQAVQHRYMGLARSLIITSDLHGQNVDMCWRRNIRTCAITLENAQEEEDDNIGLMEHFVEKMQSFGRTALIDGVFSTSMLIAAKGLGFTYISGPAVQEDVKGLKAIKPFRLQNVYSC
jgi:hypothetical protein